MKVLVLHTLPPEAVDAGRVVDEFGLDAVARNVADAVPDAIVAGVRGDAREVLKLIDEHQPDVVFNLCEAPNGRADLELHPAALLEWLGVRFTGSRSETLALCRRKDRANAVLAAAGVPVPRTDLYPCIVKPADEDGSAKIDDACVCEDPDTAAAVRARLGGRTITEQFLPGREFVVWLWGAETPDYWSIGETIFLNGLRLITYAAKWELDSDDYANSPLDYNTAIDPGLREAMLDAACRAWIAVEARGYIGVNIRCDEQGRPHVLDVNPNPELGPGVGICRACQEAGWTWERFVRQLIDWA